MFEFFLNGTDTTIKAAEFHHGRMQEKSRILSSLFAAIRETRRHIEKSRQGDEDFYFDTESPELSDKWSKVAQAIRPFNSNMASTFEMKANYWSSPEGFKRDVREGTQTFYFWMRLDEVEKEAKRLQKNWNI